MAKNKYKLVILLSIKVSRKEALKLFKWKSRRKVKKLEKLKRKDPNFKRDWDHFIDSIDKFLANGMENKNGM